MPAPTIVTNPVTERPIALWRPACSLIGLFYAAYGLRGLIDPVAGAQGFGLTQTTATGATFYIPMSGRNLTIGITAAVFIANSERRALGVLLSSMAFANLSDVYLVATSPGVTSTMVLLHAVKTVIVGAAGAMLLDYW